MRSSLAIDELSAHFAHNTTPEVWLDLVHGRLSAEEAAVAMAEAEPPELVARSVLLFAPPSAEEEERRLEALLRTPAPARRRWPAWLGPVVVGLAAAGLILVLGRPTAPPPFDGHYAIDLSPGYLEERDEPGAAQGLRRYREGQRIQIVLRPREAVLAPVGAVAFAVSEGHGTLLRIEPSVNEHGVVVIAGTPEGLGLPPGRSRLVVVVGPREHLPRAWGDVQDGADAPYDVVDEVVEISTAPDREP